MKHRGNGRLGCSVMEKQCLKCRYRSNHSILFTMGTESKFMNPTQSTTLPVVAGQIPAVPLTLEGYATLHQMMRFRWTAWRSVALSDRREITAEASRLLSGMEAKADGQS